MLGWPEMVLLLAVLLFVFGPSKLPKIAQDLGKAWREFTNASSGISEVTKSGKTIIKEDKVEIVSSMAKKLSIETEGKTTAQIADEIVLKAQNEEKKRED